MLKTTLKRIDLQEEPFTSASLIIDDSIKDAKIGQMTAIAIYSSGGNIIITFKENYDLLELLVAGEKLVGETLRTTRFKHFKAEVVP